MRAKEVVERSDRAAEQAAATTQQIPFDLLDVRPRRHDQRGFVVEARQIALEEQRDLPCMRRPGDEAQSHLVMVVLTKDRTCPAGWAKRRSERHSATSV